MVWNVYYFQTANGKFPVKEFIEKQERKIQAKIQQSITLLCDRGPFLKPPYIKKLQRNLYELRIQGGIAIRIFYSIKNKSYYLLHAFKKKSQKTPLKEMKIAIDRMKEII